MATALLLPGQGSQTLSMRDIVEEHRPDLLDLATDLVGEDPFPRVAESTRFMQPAILCTSLALLRRHGAPPFDTVAGHSVGEISALVAGGALDDEDAVRLVVRRGVLMHEAALRHGAGGMVAIVGDWRTRLDPVVAGLDLEVANVNSGEQVVLSGGAADLREASTRARAEGLRAVRLPVAAALHSRWMRPAAEAFARVVARYRFREPDVPIWSCATGEPFDDVPRRLAEGIAGQVRWWQVVEGMRRWGVDRFLEVGPGRVLTRLVRRTVPEAEVATLESLEVVDG